MNKFMYSLVWPVSSEKGRFGVVRSAYKERPFLLVCKSWLVWAFLSWLSVNM